MFVRWKTQKANYGILLSAQIVEAVRVDGKPRQRVLMHLGSIREKHMDNVYQKNHFWNRVDSRIEDLPDRDRIESQILKKVSRPTIEEFEQAEAERRESAERLRALLS